MGDGTAGARDPATSGRLVVDVHDAHLGTDRGPGHEPHSGGMCQL